MQAKKTIHQSPLSDAPDVPKGTCGTLEDEDMCDGLLYVDFGEPYGVVMCSADEVRAL